MTVGSQESQVSTTQTPLRKQNLHLHLFRYILYLFHTFLENIINRKYTKSMFLWHITMPSNKKKNGNFYKMDFSHGKADTKLLIIICEGIKHPLNSTAFGRLDHLHKPFCRAHRGMHWKWIHMYFLIYTTKIGLDTTKNKEPVRRWLIWPTVECTLNNAYAYT